MSIRIVLLLSAVAITGCDAARRDVASDPNLKVCHDYGAKAVVKVNITKGKAGDSVKGEFKCKGLVVADCTATVAAGATTANCESKPPFDATGFHIEQGCPGVVVAGKPEHWGVTCH